MTIIQLYLTMYEVLDTIWQESKNEDLACYLSESSPYTFIGEKTGKRCISADAAAYRDFKKYMLGRFPDGVVSKDKSYESIKEFLSTTFDNFWPGVSKSFCLISDEEWGELFDLGLENFKDETEDKWEI